jgi:O-antigen ligase/tetratricopeptide (TPR) repeat protein
MRQRQTLSSHPASPPRGLLAVLLALAPLAFWPGALEPFESCKAVLVELGALAFLVGVGVTGAGREWTACRGWWRGLTGDPVSLAVLLSGLAAVVSTLTSLSPRTSLFGNHEGGMGLLAILALGVIYFATRTVCIGAAEARILLAGVAVALVPITGYTLVQVAGLDPLRWEQISPFAGWTRPIATLGHPNYLAGYAVMAVPLVVWLARQQRHDGRCRLALALEGLALLACVVVVLTLSRAAWLAGVLSALLFLVARAREHSGVSSQGCRRWLIVAALAALLVVAVAAAGMGGILGERVRHLAEMASRRSLWATAGRIFCDHPITGCGVDTFDLAFGGRRTPDYWRAEWGVLPTRAHNDLLHTLATQGTLGGLAFLLLVAALCRAAWRAWHLGREEDRPLVLALAAAVMAWYVQNLFGFPVMATASLFAVLAGLLSRLGSQESGVRSQESEVRHGRRNATEGVPYRRAAQAAVVAAGTAAAFFLVIRPWLAGCACQRGEELLASEPRKALACQETSVRLDPERDVLHVKLAASALVVAKQCSDPAEQRRMLFRARTALARACDLVPANAQNHANAGRGLEVLARAGLVPADEVLAAFDRAVALDPCNTVYLADAGRAAATLGQAERAKEYLERGLTIDPDLGMLHTELAALALAKQRYPEAEKHLRQAVSTRWRGSLEGWDRTRALLCLMFLETRRPEEALPLADDLLRAHDDSVPVRWFRAIALEKLGRRLDAMQEYGRIVRLQPNHAPAQVALARLRASR